MAESGNAKDGLDALVKSIIGSIQSVGATEQAIHQQTQTVLQATTQAVTDLVKNNTYSPELATESLKMQKAMINQTIEIINGLPTDLMGAPSKSGGKA
jgi:hypothetical protein